MGLSIAVLLVANLDPWGSKENWIPDLSESVKCFHKLCEDEDGIHIPRLDHWE